MIREELNPTNLFMFIMSILLKINELNFHSGVGKLHISE